MISNPFEASSSPKITVCDAISPNAVAIDKLLIETLELMLCDSLISRVWSPAAAACVFSVSAEIVYSTVLLFA